MPDRYGFDHLGRTTPAVRCIDCHEGGPLYAWPENLRRRHARTHERARRERVAEAKAQLAVVLAGEDVAE